MRRIRHHIHRHVGVHHISTWKSFIFVLIILVLGYFGTSYSLKTYPKIFKTAITYENMANVRPGEPIMVDFSFPVLKEPYEKGIKIDPPEKIFLRWSASNKKLAILPESFWKPGTQYKIILPESKNAMFAKINGEVLSFNTVEYPKVVKIIPENNASDVPIDIEDPITLNFENSTEDFLLKFVLSPASEVSLQENVNKTQFKLMPKEKISYDMEYTIDVFAKYAYDSSDDYKKIHESVFKTQAPPEISWENNHELRIAQAKKYTQAKIKTGKYIDINLSAQIISIFENGKILDAYMISSGKRGMETPKGQTKIYNKFPRAYSKAYGLYMPFWMAIAPDGKFGLHELPEWPGGYKEGAAHLGIPVSHGCVRMGVGAAGRVYDWAEIGTPVIAY